MVISLHASWCFIRPFLEKQSSSGSDPQNSTNRVIMATLLIVKIYLLTDPLISS